MEDGDHRTSAAGACGVPWICAWPRPANDDEAFHAGVGADCAAASGFAATAPRHGADGPSGPGIFSVDVITEVAYFSPAIERILRSHAPGPLTFARFLDHFPPEDRDRVAQLMRDPALGGFHVEREIAVAGRGSVWVRLAVEHQARPWDRPRLVGTLQDVTEERRRLAEIAYLTHHDPLTGLKNRGAFEAALERAVARAGPAARTVLVVVAIEALSEARERFGRKGAEALLETVAGRLARTIRREDLLGRVGEDCFAVAMEGVPAMPEVERLQARLVAALEAEVTIQARPFRPRPAMGVALAPDDLVHGGDPMAAAETALAEARRRRFGRVLRFSPRFLESRTRYRSLVDGVRAGLARGEFVPFLQPKMALASGAVVGFEALLRWRHPDHGLLGPRAFLEALDDPDVGAALSDASLSGAIALAGRFSRAGHGDLAFAINLNAAQLERESLVGDVLTLCRLNAVPPERLTFEVVESVLIRDRPQVERNLERLADDGFAISLDDFGTGWASLANIREPFIREIKIDRSFVRRSAQSTGDLQIVGAIVNMARAMGLSVVAEGVETAAHVDTLLSLGCGTGQGFHFAPPLDASDALAFAAADPAERRVRGAA